jgi:ribose transport system permease protein
VIKDQAAERLAAGRPAGRAKARRSGARASLSVALVLIQLGPAVLLGVLWIALAFSSQYFFTALNFTNLFQAVAVTAVLAVGQLVVIVTGAIDLSAAATVTLSTIVGAKFAHGVTDSGLIVCLVMLATGVAVGLVNAFLIETLQLGTPFIITLATFSGASGLCFLLSEGSSIIGMPNLIEQVAVDKVAGVPISTLVVLAFGLLMAAFTMRVAWGRWIYAIGDNREAGARVGIPVRAVAGSTFVISGLAAALAGIFAAGLTDSSQTTPSFNAELDAISAVVIGGAALSGGRGSVFGALVGALILATIHNGLTLLHVDANWEPIVLGSVLVLAIALDKVRAQIEIGLRLRQASLQGDLVPGPEPVVAE